jgi:hypothetical protein
MLIVHPVLDSVLPYYEIDMARRETGGVVRHFNSVSDHPILRSCSEWVRDGHAPVGRIHQISCERCISDSTKADALGHLARDVELLATVAGDIRRVSAIGPAPTAASFASLQVQMTSSSAASLRWSVGSTASTGAGIVMTLLGERGTISLRAADQRSGDPAAPWQIEVKSHAENEIQTLEPFDPALAAVRQLADAVDQANSKSAAEKSTWDSATRAMEVVDAVELSLQKGRTIEVFQQELTERLAFRGTMAALGCGLMLIAFGAIVFVTLLGGAEGAVGRKVIPSWPVVLLAVLAVFLLLQAVPLLVHKSTKERQG